MNRITSIALGAAGIAFFLGTWVGTIRYHEPVSCFEDEVITWSGTTHGQCWPVSDLWMLEPIR